MRAAQKGRVGVRKDSAKDAGGADAAPTSSPLKERAARAFLACQVLFLVCALIAAPVVVAVVFFLDSTGYTHAFDGANGRITLQGEQPAASSTTSIPPGEQGSVVNASRFGIPFQMGSKYYKNDTILLPSTRERTLPVDQSGGGNPMGVGSLDESVSGFINFRRTAYDFDFQHKAGSAKRPALHYQHNSIVVEQPSFDVCEYHGPPPPFVAGRVPEMKSAFGESFTPMLFAPAKFYSFKNLGSQEAQEVNEVCVAYITECPLAPTSDTKVAKYCQETSCISDQYLPGYRVLPANESVTVSASPSSETITAVDRHSGRVFYHSALKLPYAKLTDALSPFTGCLTSERTGEPGNCRQPGVSLVSYHTHHSSWEGMPLMMQVSNPEASNDVKSGPADVSFDADYLAKYLDYRLDPAKLQNCHKITAGVVKPAYVQNVAPWPFFGENIGGDAWGPNFPERDWSATYERLLGELGRFSPEEFDVIWDYRVGTFPLDPATPTMQDRKYNVHLEKIALCSLQPDFDRDCYGNFEAANPQSKVVENFRMVTSIICLLYPALFLLQKTAFPKQHDRFGSHFSTLRLALKLHVPVGAWIIFSGTTFVICNWVEPLLFRDYHAHTGAWEVIFIISGVCGVLHALTSYRMLEAVQGDRRLTIPMYITASSLNLVNAILLLRDYDKHDFDIEMLRQPFLADVDMGLNRFLLLWASITTFIYVRAHIVLMVGFQIHYYTAYTYAIIGAAAITYPLSGQTPWVYLGLALFVIYAPMHSCLMESLNWTAYEKKNAEQATAEMFTDQVLIDMMRYRIAQRQGDLEEISRIEKEENFGAILEAEAELSTWSASGRSWKQAMPAAMRWKKTGQAVASVHRMSERVSVRLEEERATCGSQEPRTTMSAISEEGKRGSDGGMDSSVALSAGQHIDGADAEISVSVSTIAKCAV